ncbi:hypothetical protein [Lactobacillus xylocopicola]|uniref:Uncharacterized protein n=1 Tax=Lactobacillus xylocopicola TaxID=2976676 RepID=A0ABN6SJG3_9LACO|nr:hypothetical protein [Lactobacillus xylocopicola]BDR60304.1 hypothetical protein KIM322_05650 [Lactobacillus xylocopicola]
MGFDIMMICLVVGIICLVLVYKKNFSKISKDIILGLGIFFVAVAIFLATPWGSGIAHHVYDSLYAQGLFK